MKGKVADMADFFVGSEYHRPWSEDSPAWHQKKQFWESKTLWAGKYSRKCTSRVHRPLWVGSLVAFKLPHEYNFNRIGTVIGNTARRWGHVVRIVETNPYDPNDFQVYRELDFTVYPRERYWRPGNRCFVRQNVPRELYGSDQKYAIAMEMNAELDGVPMVVVDSSDSVADGDMPRYHVGARRADGQGAVLYFKEYELYNGGRLPNPAYWVSRSSSSSSSSSSAAASSSSAAAVPDIEYAGGASLQDRLDAGKESAVYVDSDLDTDEDSDKDDVMIIDPPPGPPPGPSPGPPPGPPSGPGAPPPSVAPFGMALHKMFKALRF